jgi:phage gpG-like protein
VAGMMSLAEGAALFAEMVILYEEGTHDALEKACVIIETEARSYPGEYQPGWSPLAESTIAHKATGDSPLLETGALRDSLQHTVEGHSGFVGSDSDVATFMELGTSRGVPPRSFLGLAAQQKGEEAADAVGLELFTKITRG